MYERAYGGIGFEENPLGTGAGASAGSPNLFDPKEPQRVACFAPMSRAWPARRRLASRERRKAMEGPVAEIPAQLDWSFFQSAPLDQRIDYLEGDERVVVAGCHPQQRVVDSQLPWARAAAVVYGLPGGGHVPSLVADTLRIDADAMTCSVTWRGSFPAPEAPDAVLQILAGVETRGQPIPWPSAVPGSAAAGPEAEQEIEDVTDLASTMNSGEVEDSHELMSTMMGDPSPRPAAAALPFREGASPTLPAQAPRSAQAQTGFDTLTLEDSVDRPPSVPFWRPAPQAPPPPAARPPTVPPSAPPPPEPAPTTSPAARGPRSAEGIELVNETRLALGTAPWGLSPSRDCLTVLAKATCALAPDGVVALTPTTQLTAEDRAPFKVRADVVLIGHACSPAGAVAVMEIGFAFGTEGNAFARRLRVSGDRRWESGGKPSTPEPFVRMPLGWERAFGGPSFEANPSGIGHADAMRRARRDPVPLPNLEDPDRLLRVPAQTPAPACFAPIPPAWRDRPTRRARPSLPEALDWRRFQAAPEEQQLAFLRGDEPFEITGCHPRHAVLAGALPGLRARCFSLIKGRFEEVPVRLDTVVFETDALLVHLVWRGAVGVPDERATGIDALFLMTEGLSAEPASVEEARARVWRG
jgi:hypothetical protein